MSFGFMGAVKKTVKPSPAKFEPSLEVPEMEKPAPVPVSAKRLAVYAAIGLVSVALLFWVLSRKRD